MPRLGVALLKGKEHKEGQVWPESKQEVHWRKDREGFSANVHWSRDKFRSSVNHAVGREPSPREVRGPGGRMREILGFIDSGSVLNRIPFTSGVKLCPNHRLLGVEDL